MSDNLFIHLQKNQVKLKELSLLGTNVASVSPQLLACLVVGIPRVDMVRQISIFKTIHLCRITYWHLHNTKMKISDQVSQVATLTDQRHICAIMAAVSDKVNKLQELNLSGNNLSKVACKPLPQAVQVLSRWLPSTWQGPSDI